MTCGKHPDMPVLGVCSVCGRGVCPNCGIAYMGRLHCEECFQRTWHMAPPPHPVYGQAGLAPAQEETPEVARDRQGLLGLVGGILFVAFAFLAFSFMTDLEAERDNFFFYGLAAAGIYGAIGGIGAFYAFVMRPGPVKEQKALLILLVVLPGAGLMVAFNAAVTIPFIGSIAPVVPLIGYSIFLEKMAESRFPTLRPGTKRALETMLYVKVALLIAVMPLREAFLYFWRGPGSVMIFMIVTAVGLFTIAETLWVLRAHSATMAQLQEQQRPQQQDKPEKEGQAKAKRASPHPVPTPAFAPIPVPVAIFLVLLFILLCIAPITKVNTPSSLKFTQSYGWATDSLHVTVEVVNGGGTDAEGTIEIILTNGTFTIRLASREGMTGFSKWNVDSDIIFAQLGTDKLTAGDQIRNHELQVMVVQDGDVKDTSNVRQPTECYGYVPAIIFSMAVACYVAPRLMKQRRDALDKKE